MTEAVLMRRILLALSRVSILFRNQSGAYKEGDRFIRYGLANPGGADLIGWTQVEITPAMVGEKIAVFTALEIKTATGKVTKEQGAFILAVRNAGGIADVVRSEEQAISVVKNTLR